MDEGEDEEEAEVVEDEDDDDNDDDGDNDGDDGDDDGWWDGAVAEDVAVEATVATDLDASGSHLAEDPLLGPQAHRAPECLLTSAEAVAQAAAEGIQLPRSVGESETGFLGVYTSSKATPASAPDSNFSRPRSKGRCPPTRASPAARPPRG